MILEGEFPPDVRVEGEINTLLAHGHEISLVCTTTKKNFYESNYKEATVYYLPLSKILYKLGAIALLLPLYFNFWLKHLKKIISDNKFDVIHVHDLPLISVGYRLSRMFHIPCISDLHENRPEIMKMYCHVNTFPGNILISTDQWEKYQAEYSRKVDYLILVTEEARQYYAKRYNVALGRICVVPNYVDIKALKSIELDNAIINRYKDKFMLIYFGDTGTRRGTIDIIEAARMLKDKTEFHFVIIGVSREQKMLEQKIREYNISNVELTGYLPFNKITSYIKAARAGLCPFLKNMHHDTTYANKLFQYMYFGKPVIVSNCTAQASIVKKESCGLVYEAGNPKQLAKSVVRLAASSLIKDMGEKGAKAVCEKYNPESGNAELLKLYRSLKNG